MINYRQIWIKKHGKIPIDNNGRSYEIHHIDGNRKNNSIENLVCISIDEHYQIHLKNGQIHAANLIANRMNKPLLTGHHCTDEVKKKISDSKKGKLKSETHKQKMSDAKKGKVFTESHKQNLKKEKLKLTCPVCGLTGGANAIKRFHYDKCGKPYIFKRNK